MTVPSDDDAKRQIALQVARWVEQAMCDTATATAEATCILTDPMFPNIDEWNLTEAARASGQRVYATIRPQVDALLDTAGLSGFAEAVARVCCARIDEEIGWMLVNCDNDKAGPEHIAELAASFDHMSDLAARQAAFDIQEVLGIANDDIRDVIGPVGQD